jgi:hypothetical protein
MTKYITRISFLAHIDHADACNRAANALGRSGQNFSLRLSASGVEPATHLGGSTVETELFLAAVAAAPELPEGIPWPDDLEPTDWRAVADHLIAVSGPAVTTNAREQFEALLNAHGQQFIPSQA